MKKKEERKRKLSFIITLSMIFHQHTPFLVCIKNKDGLYSVFNEGHKEEPPTEIILHICHGKMSDESLAFLQFCLQ